jgi:putative transposase
MPSRNEIKEYVTDGIYHVYNRGVARRTVFSTGYEYRHFISLIRQSLDREPSMELLAFCLMPNHFHLLLRQAEADTIERFMRRLTIGYVSYFNKRRARVGPLFQGKYKAVRVVGPLHLMDATRYILRNPERAGLDWRQHTWSSRVDYLDPVARRGFVNPEPVLELFDRPEDFWRFIELRAHAQKSWR